MKAHHKGYEIEVHRDECVGGWEMMYYTVVRESDGRICLDNFEDNEETLADMITRLKCLIDIELREDDPWGERWDNELPF